MSEKILKHKIGATTKEMTLTMINVNHDPIPFNDIEDIEIDSIDYLDKSINLFHEIRNEIEKTGNSKKNVDDILVPFWFSPNGSSKLFGSRKPFKGNTRTQELYDSMNIYSSRQLFARWLSSDICAALDSKIRYDSLGIDDPEPLIGGGYENSHVEYCKKRGICIEVGRKSNEICRYMTSYKMENGKNNIIFICGDKDFIGGSVDIFNKINIYSKSIQSYQKNDIRKGINLEPVSINNAVLFSDNDIDAFKKNMTLSIVRLLSGACILHDYLCLIRDYYGVNKLINTSVNSEYTGIDINEIIEDYSKVKKYSVTARALSAIA